jgi:predicted amidohydrolase
MKIGYIQTSPVFGDKEANFNGVLELAKDVKADLP